MDQILNKEELEIYQNFLNGKIVIIKFGDDDLEHINLCYKGKCYNLHKEKILNEKEMKRDFLGVIFTKNYQIKKLDTELIIEKYKGKCLIVNDIIYFYVNDDLIFTEDFKKVKLIDYITDIYEQYIYYEPITTEDIIDLTDGKLEFNKKEEKKDIYSDEVEKLLRDIQF